MKITRIILGGVLAVALFAGSAQAMTGLEWLQASFEDQIHALDPCVPRFVAEGYHNVPDTGALAYYVRELILKKGYRDVDINTIAEEAAVARGMAK
jgi:hypothetical protein